MCVIVCIENYVYFVGVCFSFGKYGFDYILEGFCLGVKIVIKFWGRGIKDLM